MSLICVTVNDSGYQILYTIHNRHEKLLLKQIYYSDKSQNKKLTNMHWGMKQ